MELSNLIGEEVRDFLFLEPLGVLRKTSVMITGNDFTTRNNKQKNMFKRFCHHMCNITFAVESVHKLNVTLAPRKSDIILG